MTILVGLIFAAILAAFLFVYLSERNKRSARAKQAFMAWLVLGILKSIPWMMAFGLTVWLSHVFGPVGLLTPILFLGLYWWFSKETEEKDDYPVFPDR